MKLKLILILILIIFINIQPCYAVNGHTSLEYEPLKNDGHTRGKLNLYLFEIFRNNTLKLGGNFENNFSIYHLDFMNKGEIIEPELTSQKIDVELSFLYNNFDFTIIVGNKKILKENKKETIIKSKIKYSF